MITRNEINLLSYNKIEKIDEESFEGIPRVQEAS